MKAVFTEPGDVKKDLRAVWDKPTKEFAIGQLAQESARFLEAYGKPLNFWNLEDVDCPDIGSDSNLVQPRSTETGLQQATRTR